MINCCPQEDPGILGHLKILMDHPIQARRRDLVINNKKTIKMLSFGEPWRSGISKSENQRKRWDSRILRSRKKTGKVVELDVEIYTSYSWGNRNGPQELGEGTRVIVNLKTNWDHPNYCIVKIDQNIEKNHVDLRKRIVTNISRKRPSVSTDVRSLLQV